MRSVFPAPQIWNACVQLLPGFRFITQCVVNRKDQEELPHVSQIAGIEPPAKLRIEPTREIFEHRIAVRRALPAALLLLDDFLADFAVSRWLPNGLPFSGGPVSGSPAARPC